MKTTLAIWLIGCLTLTLGCSAHYDYDYTTIVAASDGGSDPVDGGDSEDTDMKGTSASKTMVRGNHSPTNVLNASFADDKGNPQAGVYTVQFTLQPSGSTATEPATQCAATITWTIDGVQVVRAITVSNGAAITGVGTGCVVQLVDQTNGITPPDPNPTYDVGVTLTPGTRGTGSQPPTYYPPQESYGGLHGSGGGSANANIPANSQKITIPKGIGIVSANIFVYSINLTSQAPLTPNAEVDQLAPDGSVVASYNPLDYTGFVPINPAANAIQIVNRETNNLTTMTWSLVFGIDG